MDGKEYKLSQYRGKVVIINFWTTWCPPCAYEMPALDRMWKKAKKRKLRIEVLAINIGQDEDAIFSFLGKFPVDFPLIMDRKGEIVKQWKVIALPTTFVIDKDGYIVYKAIGGRDWDHDDLIKKVNAHTK
jgi:peroxiredoxin